MLSINQTKKIFSVCYSLELIGHPVQLLASYKKIWKTVGLSFAAMDQRQAMPLPSVITFYRPSLLFSPVPAVSRRSLTITI